MKTKKNTSNPKFICISKPNSRLKEFNDKINELLNDGYELYGNVQMCGTGAAKGDGYCTVYGPVYLTQVLIKKTSKKRKLTKPSKNT